MAELDATTKFCPDCNADRPLEEFYEMRAGKYAGGYRYSAYCRKHTIERNRKARTKAPEGSPLRESIRRANKKWAQQNPEANREAQRRWRERHPELAKQRHRDWQLKNPGKNREKALRYYLKKRRERLADDTEA